MDPQNKSFSTPSNPATPSNGLSNDAQEVTVTFNDTPAPGAATPAGVPSPTNSAPANDPMAAPITPAGAAADGIPDASLESTFPAPTPLQSGPGNPASGSANFGAPAGGPTFEGAVPGRPGFGVGPSAAPFGPAPGSPGPQAPGAPGGLSNQPMPAAPNPYPGPPAPFGQQPNAQPFNASAAKKPLDKKTFFILMGAALVLIVAIAALFFLK